MPKTSDTFRELASKLMRAKNLSQSELGRRMGVSASMINQYMAGRSNPGLDVVERFADALGVYPWELIKPDGATPTPRETPLPDGVREAIRAELANADVPETMRPLIAALKAQSKEEQAQIAGLLSAALKSQNPHLLPALAELAELITTMHKGKVDTLLLTARNFARNTSSAVSDVRNQPKKVR